MKDRMISIIAIDPFMKSIMINEIENSLYGLQHAIGDHNIELVNLENNDIMYVPPPPASLLMLWWFVVRFINDLSSIIYMRRWSNGMTMAFH